MTSIVGGPTPVAQAAPVPVSNRDDLRAEARQAAVAVSTQAPSENRKSELSASYGTKSSVTAQEASARYDAHGKVAESRYKEHRDHKVDREV